MSQAGIIEIESAHPQIPTAFVTNVGTAVPLANVLEILGTTVANHSIPLETTGSGNMVTVVAQYAAATAATTTTAAGFASFNSAQFIVDTNGFVSANPADFVIELTGNSGTAHPDGSGNINIVTANMTFGFMGVGSTLTLDAALPTLGFANLGIGSSFPAITIGGQSNTGYGIAALSSIISGRHNTGLGAGSLQNLTTPNYNTFVGSQSGLILVSGSMNCGYGYESLASLVSNNSNAAFGYQTLLNCTGSSNTAIGTSAGSNYTGNESSNVLLFNNGTVGESNVMRLGTPGSQTSAYAAGITGVTVAASSPVGVNSSGQLSDLGFGTTGQVLTSTGPASSPTWQGTGADALSIKIITHSASPYTVLATDQFLACQTSGGIITILLPNAPTTGRVIYIKDSNGASATSNISLTTVGGTVTIDGLTTYTINDNYQSLNVVFDGSNYEVF